MWRPHGAHIWNSFVSDHSEETWNRNIIICPYKRVSVPSWVCLCVEMTDIKLGVKQRSERHTKKKQESENPCSCCLAIITYRTCANSECQMVPITVLPCLWNGEERGRSRVACGTGKLCLMWMMCHINTNHAKISPTAKLDPRSSSTSTHSQSSPCSGTVPPSLSEMINRCGIKCWTLTLEEFFSHYSNSIHGHHFILGDISGNSLLDWKDNK